MIKAVRFDLDNTLMDFMTMKENAINAAVKAMIDAGLNMDPLKAHEELYAIYHEKGKLTVSTSQEPYYILMEITDNGIGISKSVKDKIFEPYYSTKESGSGLGLLIASRIVTEHGGTIELESTEGQGTTVKVRIPIRLKKIRLLPEGKRKKLYG